MGTEAEDFAAAAAGEAEHAGGGAGAFEGVATIALDAVRSEGGVG